MKKLFKIGIRPCTVFSRLIILFAIFTAFSCSKTDKSSISQIVPISKSSITNSNAFVQSGLLIFPTFNDYQKEADSMDQEFKNSISEFLNNLDNFNSFENWIQSQDSSIITLYDTLMNDEYFRSILNSDASFQIAQTIFHINFLKREIFTLDTSNQRFYADLINEDTTKPYIGKYSTDDNIFEILGYENDTTKLCSESGIGSYSKKSPLLNFWAYYNYGGTQIYTNFTAQGIISYCRWGVYFYINSEFGVTPDPNDILTISGEFDPVYYKPRCRNAQGPYHKDITGGHEYKYKSYQGSRAIHSVYFRANYTCLGQSTGFFELKKNY